MLDGAHQPFDAKRHPESTVTVYRLLAPPTKLLATDRVTCQLDCGPGCPFCGGMLDHANSCKTRKTINLSPLVRDDRDSDTGGSGGGSFEHRLPPSCDHKIGG
jgi:hypothetical protein